MIGAAGDTTDINICLQLEKPCILLSNKCVLAMIVLLAQTLGWVIGVIN